MCILLAVGIGSSVLLLYCTLLALGNCGSVLLLCAWLAQLDHHFLCRHQQLCLHGSSWACCVSQARVKTMLLQVTVVRHIDQVTVQCMAALLASCCS